MNNPMAYESFRPKKFPLDPFASAGSSSGGSLKQDIKLPVRSQDNQASLVSPWFLDVESCPRLLQRQKARENVVLVIGEPSLSSLQTILQSQHLQSPSSLLIIASHRPPAAPLLIPHQSENQTGASPRCRIRILHLAQPITSPTTGSARVVEVLEWAERTARVWRHERASSSTPSPSLSPSSPTPPSNPTQRPRAKLRSKLSPNLSNFTAPSKAESEDENAITNADVQVHYELADPLSPKRFRAQSAFLHGGSTSNIPSLSTSPVSPQTPSPTSTTHNSNKFASSKSKSGNSSIFGSTLPPWNPTHRAFDVVLHFISPSSGVDIGDGSMAAMDMDYKMSLRNSILVSTALRPYLVATAATTAIGTGTVRSSSVQRTAPGANGNAIGNGRGETIKMLTISTTSDHRVESASSSRPQTQAQVQSKKWLFFRSTSAPSGDHGISPHNRLSVIQQSPAISGANPSVTSPNSAIPEPLDTTSDPLDLVYASNAARLIHILPSRFSPASANSATIPSSTSNMNALFIRSLESFLLTFCSQPYGLGPAPKAPGVSPFSSKSALSSPTSPVEKSTGKKSGGKGLGLKGLGLKNKGILGRSESAPVLGNGGTVEGKGKPSSADEKDLKLVSLGEKGVSSSSQQVRVRPYVLMASSLGDVLRVSSNVSPVDGQQAPTTAKFVGYALTLLDLIICGSLDPSPPTSPSRTASSTPTNTLSPRSREKQREYEKGAKFDLWDDVSEGKRPGEVIGTRAWIGSVADLVVRTRVPQVKRLPGMKDSGALTSAQEAKNSGPVQTAYTPRSKPLPPIELDITDTPLESRAMVDEVMVPLELKSEAPVSSSPSSSSPLSPSHPNLGSSSRPLSPTTTAKRNEKETNERLRIERQERERREKETKERERAEREERERREMEEKARIKQMEKEKADRERWEKERAQRLERERKEMERAERAERERVEKEKAEREQEERERVERERVAKEKADRERRKEIERQEMEREQQRQLSRARSPSRIVTEDPQSEKPYHYRRASQTRLQQSPIQGVFPATNSQNRANSPPASPNGAAMRVSRSTSGLGTSPTSTSPIRNVFSTRTPVLPKPQRRATMEISTGQNGPGIQNGYSTSSGSIAAGAFQLKRALSADHSSGSPVSGGRVSPNSGHWFQYKSLTTDPQVHGEPVVDQVTGLIQTGSGPSTPPDSSEDLDEGAGSSLDTSIASIGSVGVTAPAVMKAAGDVNAHVKSQQHQYSRYPNAWPAPPSKTQSQSAAIEQSRTPVSSAMSRSMTIPNPSPHPSPSYARVPHHISYHPPGPQSVIAAYPVLPGSTSYAAPATSSDRRSDSGMAGIGSGMGLRASTLGLPYAQLNIHNKPYAHHHHRSQSHPIPHGFGYVIREAAEA